MKGFCFEKADGFCVNLSWLMSDQSVIDCSCLGGWLDWSGDGWALSAGVFVLSSLPFSLSHRTKRKVWNISSSNGECVSAWWISQSDSRQATDWIIILTNSSNRPLHGIRHRKIQSSQCACRGQKVNSIPLNCVLTREFLVKTKPTCCVVDCENRTSSVTASY